MFERKVSSSCSSQWLLICVITTLFGLSVCLCVCLSVCLSVYLSVCLCVCLTVCLSVSVQKQHSVQIHFIPKNAPTMAICSFEKHGLILIISVKQHQHTFKNDTHIHLWYRTLSTSSGKLLKTCLGYNTRSSAVAERPCDASCRWIFR